MKTRTASSPPHRACLWEHAPPGEGAIQTTRHGFVYSKLSDVSMFLNDIFHAPMESFQLESKLELPLFSDLPLIMWFIKSGSLHVLGVRVRPGNQIVPSFYLQ